MKTTKSFVTKLTVTEFFVFYFIYLSLCCDKDCLENIRVYLTACGQEVVDKAISVKCTKAEVIWVFTDVDC